MAEERKSLIKTLKYQRGQIKAQVTRFATYLSDINSLDHSELKHRLDKIRPCLDKYETIQLELAKLDESDEPQFDDPEFENLYFELISKADSLLQHPIKAVDSSEHNVNLPQINLPTFFGDFCHWLEFRDAFLSLIDNNSKLSNIQKYYYLRASVKGDAARVIHSLEITDANYKVAFNMLVDRFENKKLIIHNHIKAIFALQSFQRESHVELRNLLDDTNKHLSCLKALKQPVDSWDLLIIYILSNKFDSVTRREWESYKLEGDVPTMKDLKSFLKHKCEVLECVSANQTTKPSSSYNYTKQFSNGINSNKAVKSHSITLENKTCANCNKAGHLIYNCKSFLALSVEERKNLVRAKRLCLNCLRKNHIAANCKLTGCKTCGKLHNALLHHLQNVSTSNMPILNANTSNNLELNEMQCNATSVNAYQNVLLSTVQLKLRDKSGNYHLCKGLLDSGSQCNLISHKLFKLLNLDSKSVNVTMQGINQKHSPISLLTNIKLQAAYTNYSRNIQCFIVPKITDKLPSINFNKNVLDIPRDLCLADQSYFKSSSIDILLGVDLFWELLCVGQIKLGEGLPILHKTKLGWIISGPLEVPTHTFQTFSLILNDGNKQKKQLRSFWNKEDYHDPVNSLSTDNAICENKFITTIDRNSSGRFIVTIPFKINICNLGNSYELALNRYLKLEAKLNKNVPLKQQYHNFIRDYINLNHMREVRDNRQGYFIPHHCVIKNNSLTTKLRVVFDASARTTSGLSLNDVQYTGQKFQNDLTLILLRFRRYNIIYAGDIEMMYRQILVKENQRKYQQILWRFNATEPIKTYELTTLTYGLSSSPYLAMRCLKQLAIDFKANYPNECNIINRDFYVDDLISGSDSVENALLAIRNINKILTSAGFNLRKWQTNNKNLLNELSNCNMQSMKDIGGGDNNAILGIYWNSRNDTINFKINFAKEKVAVTKRNILSQAAKIFDPLGLVSPVIIIAKLLIQKLWTDKLGWDESLPTDLHSLWLKFKEQLHVLNKLVIPRHAYCTNSVNVEIHGFCDASQRAYGAAIYIKSMDIANNITVRLLCAKSRVAPIKNTTLPRLELRGAVLLSELMQQCYNENLITDCPKYFWTDSMIVLGWIRGQPHKYKTFVSNRIKLIQSVTDTSLWFHVGSQDNPADIVSRGLFPLELVKSKLWWEGPLFLLKNKYNGQTIIDTNTSEDIEVKIQNLLTTSCEEFDLLIKFSCLHKLIRVTAYCLRFIFNCKDHIQNRRLGNLTKIELNIALLSLVKYVQGQHFQEEITKLSNDRAISSRSSLLLLNPYVDKEGILRVGGRLDNSLFNENKKHPAILPFNAHLTVLILKNEHERLLHCGPQLLLSSIRDTYWPIKGRIMVNRIYRNCIPCFKSQPKFIAPLMGHLPKHRTLNNPPFHVSGVDYAGPILIRDRWTRNYKLMKSYIVLFICLSTKAIHLDLVTSLCSDAFLDVLKRFIARRGKPAAMYSDNGTNFIGIQADLKSFLVNSKNINRIQNAMSREQIEWHFIPAKSPHFGGLWEAGIKSVKRHLVKIVKNSNLNYEHLYTLLAQIESILNSRPLTLLSDCPDDPQPLTPGHFLIGRSLTALCEAEVLDTATNRLSKYQHIQKLKLHFWKRWNKEYISELQTRTKWQSPQVDDVYLPGRVVILKEDNLPPLKWRLGRIVEVFRGCDNIIRVASVKVGDVIVKRAITKLALLPSNEDSQTDDS